jgi:hypothetical protein
MVAADIPEIREAAAAEGITVEYYPRSDSARLAQHLCRLLGSRELRAQIAERNLTAARGMQLSQFVGAYLDLFQSRLKTPIEVPVHP